MELLTQLGRAPTTAGAVPSLAGYLEAAWCIAPAAVIRRLRTQVLR